MNNLQLENHVPIYTNIVKRVEKEYQVKKTEFYKLVEDINKEYVDAGLGHLIHLRDDGTINWDGCCRSCLWHP